MEKHVAGAVVPSTPLLLTAAAAACPQAELTAVNEQMKSSHTMLPPRWGEYTQRKEASNIHLAHISFQPS